ncbi:MAG: amidase [Luteolibacter sp.]|uniref:amidase n=1 Tax=Luteolibacter sp. TaxID=1962973 RepID=UPI00326666DC
MLNRALSLIFLVSLLGSCAPLRSGERSRSNAFTAYFGGEQNDGTLRVAVKDLIDMKGMVTSAGSEYLSKNRPPAKRDADCLAITRARKDVQIVGKANLTEFAITVSGRNGYFGTPVNRLDGKHKFIPGGSSSGSAVAVSTGQADVAFGTDTGGSVRVPAACCGIYGLKTTFGLVSTKGVFPVSPKYLDTVGPMAADLPHLVEGMGLLQQGFKGRYSSAVSANPSARQIRIGRLYIAGTDPAIDKAIDDRLAAKGFKIVKLDADFAKKWAQAEADGETIATSDAWKNDSKYTDSFEIDSNTRAVLAKGAVDRVTGFDAAVKRRAAWKKALARVFQKVDFIATPTLKILPPRLPFWRSTSIFELIILNAQNTIGINLSGNPGLAMPIEMPESNVPTSLQLIGPPLSEAELLNACRLLQIKP